MFLYNFFYNLLIYSKLRPFYIIESMITRIFHPYGDTTGVQITEVLYRYRY